MRTLVSFRPNLVGPHTMHLDECSRLFNAVRSARTVAEACYRLEPIFEQYTLLNIELGRSNVFWRARHTDRPFDDPECLGPPPKIATRTNRLNDASAPCLYAATREETALLEVDARPGQFLQLAGYRCKGDTTYRVALLGELRHVQQTGFLRLTGTDPTGSIARLLDEQGLEKGRRTIFIDSFLAALLSDKDAAEIDYVLSRAVAAMVYRDQAVEGFFFPSTKGLHGMNIVLLDKPAREKLHLTSSLFVRVDAVREFGFVDFTVLVEAESIGDDGRFRWKEPKPGRRAYFNLTKQESESGMVAN